MIPFNRADGWRIVLWSGLFLLCRFILPSGMPLILAAGGLALTKHFNKKVEDPWIRRVILGGYLLKVAATFVLFYISDLHLPLMKEHQLGDGFWVFAMDAAVYHSFGVKIVHAIWSGGAFPAMAEEWPMNIYVGILYFFLGICPLHAALLNAWYGSFSAFVGHALLRRYNGDPKKMRTAMCLLLFWPSLLLWSTQVMKDPLFILLMLVTSGLILTAPTAPQDHRLRRARWIDLAVSVFLLVLFRNYIGLSIALATWLVVCGTHVFRKPRKIRIAILLALAVGIPTGVGMRLRNPELFSTFQSSRAAEITRNTAQFLGNIRDGIVRQEGASTIDPDFQPHTFGDIVWYLPKAMRNVFLSPFPWEWPEIVSHQAGRAFIALEMLLVYFLLASALFSLPALMSAGNIAAWFFLVFVLILSVPLGVAMPNLGTLFRLRLQVLVPLMLIFGLRNSRKRSISAFVACFVDRAPSLGQSIHTIFRQSHAKS